MTSIQILQLLLSMHVMLLFLVPLQLALETLFVWLVFPSINSGLSTTSLALAPVLTPEIVEDPSCTETVVQ